MAGESAHFGASLKSTVYPAKAAGASKSRTEVFAGSIQYRSLLRVRRQPKAAADKHHRPELYAAGREQKRGHARRRDGSSGTGFSRSIMPAVVGLGCIGQPSVPPLCLRRRVGRMGLFVHLRLAAESACPLCHW